MSTPSADELTDVLRQVREHTEFLRELGVEHLSLDSGAEVASNISTAPANQLAGAKPRKVNQVEIPHRAASPESRRRLPRQADSNRTRRGVHAAGG